MLPSCLKVTAIVKLKGSPGNSGGGAGNAAARSNILLAAPSKEAYPQLFTTWAVKTRP